MGFKVTLGCYIKRNRKPRGLPAFHPGKIAQRVKFKGRKKQNHVLKPWSCLFNPVVTGVGVNVDVCPCPSRWLDLFTSCGVTAFLFALAFLLWHAVVGV